MSSFAATRARILQNLGEDARVATLSGVREVLTEENTDAIIERIVSYVKPRLPFYLKWLPLGTVLDSLLPGALLKVFDDLLG